MNLRELRNLSKKDLKTEKNRLNEEIFKFKKEHWQGKLKDTDTIRKKRKELARILTVIREKEVLRDLSSRSSNVKAHLSTGSR